MKKHTTYRGYRKDGKPIIRRTPLGERLTPGRSRVLHEHAPEFDWGYRGSKPKQLALAILLDWSVDESLALKHHEDFEKEVVASFEKADNWTLGPHEIQEHITSLRNRPTPRTTTQQEAKSV